MEEYKQNIYDILLVCAEYLENPEDPQKSLNYETMKKDLVIKSYMPLKQKELVLRKAILDIRAYDEMPYSFAVAEQMALLFDCLFGYVTSCDPNFGNEVKKHEFYDVLYAAEIPQYILSFCAEDFFSIKEMLARTITYDNLQELLKTVDFASSESIEELTNEFKKFRMDADPEVIKGLATILSNNDPLLNSVKNTIENSGFESIKKIENKEGE